MLEEFLVKGRVPLIATIVVLVALSGCSSGSQKGRLDVGVYGRVSNTAGTCVTLATPGIALSAGSHLCMKDDFGKVGSCIFFLEANWPMGARATNAASWISGQQATDSAHCKTGSAP
jgi:hypothetical protein